MGVFQNLAVVALRQVACSACNAVGMGAVSGDVVKFLDDRFTDHSQKLMSALQTANDRAWKALEIALAGDSLLQRCTAAAEDKAFAQQIRAFLDASPLNKVKPEKRPILDKALQELRSARNKGLLAAGPLAPGALAKEAGALAAFREPQAIMEAEWKALGQVGDALREYCPNLCGVLRARFNPPILAVAVCYYFRREIETDKELFQGLAIAKFDALQESQNQGFAELTAALSRQGDRLEETLAGISGVIVEIDKTTKDTNARVRAMEQTIQKLLEQLQLQNREVRASDSMSVRSEGERQLVKQLVAEYRNLPEQKRRQLPGLLNNLGKLELAAGDFGEAQQKFQTVANMEADPKTQAEAHYNAYQAALQRQAWVGALASMKQAVALDPERFLPFPAEYEPTRILGAGGFGVAFLCHHKFMNDDVVVKTLQTDELDDSVDRVFTEAQALKRLDHPSIIRLSTCGYADPRGKARPYLAMDYFDGVNLESYVAEQGPLSPDELLGIAVPVAEALQAAHARGLLHRDVKPANILVRREGDAWRVKLIDFGLALQPSTLEGQASTSGPKAQTTMGKTIAGTLYYAAPEQMGQSPGVVGAYSDVYGFGKTCYYALFRAPDPDDEEKEDLPDSWRSLLRKCTRKDTARRLPDFGAVLADLVEMRRPADNKEPPGQPDEERWRKNHPVAVACARWYMERLTELHLDVRQEFAKTVITLYVDGKVRVAVWPKKNDRASITVEKFSEAAFAEAIAYLTREGIPFTTRKIDTNNILVFDVSLQQLNEKRATHEWIVQRLLAIPASRAGANDEGAADTRGDRPDGGHEIKAMTEVSVGEYVVKELETGSIEVLRDGVPVVPVKPVLRELALRLNVALLNSGGMPLNTRQLGRQIIKKAKRVDAP